MEAIAKYIEVNGEKKLFALSNDIEVGDEIIDFYFNGLKGRCIEKFPMGYMIKYKGDRKSTNTDKYHIYKIIGEISLKAKWVNENDEINVFLIQQKRYGINNFEKYIEAKVKCLCCGDYK